MAVNLSKEAYRQTEVIREITPVHILTEEQTMHATNEITPVHLFKEEDTTIASIDEEENNTECTSDRSDEPPFICTLIVPALTIVFGVVLLLFRDSIATSVLYLINESELGEIGEKIGEICGYFFNFFGRLCSVLMVMSGVLNLAKRMLRY